MRHGIHLSILSLALLTACGPEGEVGDPGSDEGDEGWQLNTDSDTRQTCTACPNGGKVTPKAPTFTKSIDAYASYVGQSTCSGTSKPGVVAFKNLVLATYPCTSSGGIVRGCSVGGTSEHKEGRAWDWMVNAPSTAVDSMLGWLLATDSFGNKHAMARRLGIMYMIWNRKMWRAYRPNDGWQAYTGSNPHTDHVHFSFSWAGAKKTTSYWNAPAAPAAPTTPAPTPAPSTPAAQAPKGALETVNCSEIVGWAQDPDAPTGAVDVEVYIDQLPGAAGSSPLTAKANINRTDLCTTLGSCEHGFKIETPATYRDNQTHTVRTYALDAGARTLIGGPVGISCSSSIDPQAQDPQQPSPEASDGEVEPTPEATPEQVSLVGTCALAAAPRLSDGWWLLALVGLALLRRRGA